jgi:hypothetical protein
MIIVGVKDERSVPYGTVIVTVSAPIVPGTPNMLNAVISFAEESAAVTVTV